MYFMLDGPFGIFLGRLVNSYRELAALFVARSKGMYPSPLHIFYKEQV